MSLIDAEKIVELLKHPKKALLILVLSLILLVLTAYITSFFSEKGKQHASPLKENRGVPSSVKPEQEQLESASQATEKRSKVSPASKPSKQKSKKANAPDIMPKTSPRTEGDQNPVIIQETKGDQSPAVNVGPGGTSTITYGGPKDKKGKE